MAPQIAAEAEAILQRCRHLIHEYNILKSAIEDQDAAAAWVNKKLSAVDIEMKSIRKLIDAADGDDIGSLRARLSGTNTLAFEAQWAAMKKCKGVVTGMRRIPALPGPYAMMSIHKKGTMPSTHQVTVHGIVDGNHAPSS